MALSRVGKVGAVSTGPIPNRTDDLSRDRDANRNGRPPVSKGVMREVVIPKVNPTWHDIAKMMWHAAQNSGMADFYQQTDWAYLYSLLDDLSTLKKRSDESGGKINGQIMTTIYSALAHLGFTEGDRRQMRIELESPKDESIEDASVVAITDYKKILNIA